MVVSVEETHDPVRVPVSVANLPPADEGPPPHPPTRRWVLLWPIDCRDRGPGFVVEDLVGVDRQDPIMTGPHHRVAFLRPIPLKRSLKPAHMVSGGDLPSAVGRARIEDDDFVAAIEGSEHPVESIFRVPGYQNG